MRLRLSWVSFVLAGLVSAAAAQQPAPGPGPVPAALTGRQVTVMLPQELDYALAATNGVRVADVVWLRISLAAISPEQAQAILAWVAGGGTLWTETDAVSLFGLVYVPVTDREEFGHARRACAPEASPLVEGVTDLWYRVEPGDVFLLSDPRLVPLLRVADPSEPPVDLKLVSAELAYGQGRVIHRPAEINLDRADGRIFEANLFLTSTPDDSEVVIPLDQLVLAQERLTRAVAQPAEAPALLGMAALAYRLWWAEFLSGVGQLDEALVVLRKLATDLPQDPAVYLAVARYNERVGRMTEAAAARRQAAAILGATQAPWPGPETPRLRAPRAMIEETLVAIDATADPAPPTVAADLLARTNHLLALDTYRRGDLASAERLWADSFRLAPSVVSAYGLGLVQRTWADEIQRPGRDRFQLYGGAAEWFARAAQGSYALDPGLLARADQWAQTSAALAAQTLREPPATVAQAGFVFRYDDGDPALLETGFMQTVEATLAAAYSAIAPYGLWLEPVEVLVAPDQGMLRAMLPNEPVTPSPYAETVIVGRRIYLTDWPIDLEPQLRHAFIRVVANALTEGGYPAPTWFAQGLAVLAENDPTRLQFAASNLRRDPPMTFAQLDTAVAGGNVQAAEHALGQSALMVRSLLDQVGPTAVVPFLMNMGWGTLPELAFTELTGVRPVDWLQRWYAAGPR